MGANYFWISFTDSTQTFYDVVFTNYFFLNDPWVWLLLLFSQFTVVSDFEESSQDESVKSVIWESSRILIVWNFPATFQSKSGNTYSFQFLKDCERCSWNFAMLLFKAFISVTKVSSRKKYEFMDHWKYLLSVLYHLMQEISYIVKTIFVQSFDFMGPNLTWVVVIKL